jgi:hypothetical protein
MNVLKLFLSSCLIFLFFVFIVELADAAVGDTSVAKWKDNKKGAYTMNYDDGDPPQATMAVPAVLERGLIATWYPVPARNSYKNYQSVWEVDVLNDGQEFANHTWSHNGWSNCTEARSEVEKANTHWRNLTGDYSLMAYANPGGVPRNCDSATFDKILSDNDLVKRYDNKGIQKTASEIIAYARGALEQGIWRGVVIHNMDGSGCCPLKYNDFIQLLDYLYSVKNELWIDGWMATHKYMDERDAANVSVLSTNSDQIRLRMNINLNTTLYNEPLTLLTTVPSNWASCFAYQGSISMDCFVNSQGKAQYNAVPGKGDITLNRSGTVPSATPTTKPGVPGDANGDDQVNVDDYVIWLNNYSQSKQGSQFGDFNNSGKVDGVDYVVWLTNFGS